MEGISSFMSRAMDIRISKVYWRFGNKLMSI
jgi:hypothetical protein